MVLRVPLYKYKLCSTYGYLRTSISSVTPTGDLNKYKLCSTYEYLRKCVSSVNLMGDLNKYKSSISTSMCISLLYEFMKNSNIFYCIFVTIICLL